MPLTQIYRRFPDGPGSLGKDTVLPGTLTAGLKSCCPPPPARSREGHRPADTGREGAAAAAPRALPREPHRASANPPLAAPSASAGLSRPTPTRPGFGPSWGPGSEPCRPALAVTENAASASRARRWESSQGHGPPGSTCPGTDRPSGQQQGHFVHPDVISGLSYVSRLVTCR